MRDLRDVRDPYFRERERDYRDTRDRDVRGPRDIRDVRDRDPRDPRDLRDLRDQRDPRDPRDIRDVRDRREPYPPRRPDDRRPEPRVETRLDNRNDRRAPPPDAPKTVMVKRKRIIARPTLTTEFAASDSVYYRKPGNESVVGSGTYGKVFKGVHVYTKDQVALKKIRMEGERDGFPVTAIREVKLLQSLNHDNIVRLREVMVEKNDCYMVFEYLSHDLTGLLNHPTFNLEESHKKDLAKQLFEGLDYLHRRGVLHRDIKAANILVSNTGQLKLADFGLARFYAKSSKLDYTNRVITIWYRSPELLLGETQYGPAVDIWSAACVLVEIFTRHAIFPGDGGEINQLDKIYNILGTPTKEDWPGIVDMQWSNLLRPTERKPSTFEERYRDRLSPMAFELLQAMFLYDPLARPTAADVLEHPFFASEQPQPKRAEALKALEGDWHEFESKALRKEKGKADKEARRVAREESKKEEGKRRADATDSERDAKRVKSSETQ
ncbi:Pkinase-domain-containing protein [Didymella exigua CBS 183.55]|uniref:cyclin-dependent kinase n=1 Tax=Didymella exigua CBS 183.55 TaxID=1150837 RepID=A0A6A5RJ71_9PLEO|nr:Pkinase-domain-containing protein [Didymella exigua CBS 183.55]KAF1928425.1 Pkinase-domain-containing protein [Didymella exigua CBS 183.55]